MRRTHSKYVNIASSVGGGAVGLLCVKDGVWRGRGGGMYWRYSVGRPSFNGVSFWRVCVKRILFLGLMLMEITLFWLCTGAAARGGAGTTVGTEEATGAGCGSGFFFSDKDTTHFFGGAGGSIGGGGACTGDGGRVLLSPSCRGVRGDGERNERGGSHGDESLSSSEDTTRLAFDCADTRRSVKGKVRAVSS